MTREECEKELQREGSMYRSLVLKDEDLTVEERRAKASFQQGFDAYFSNPYNFYTPQQYSDILHKQLNDVLNQITENTDEQNDQKLLEKQQRLVEEIKKNDWFFTK